jgi:hypothetical protein
MGGYKWAAVLVLAVLFALHLTAASAQQAVYEVQLNPEQTTKKECVAQIRVTEGEGTFTTTGGQVVNLQGTGANCVCIHRDGTATPGNCPTSILAFSVGGAPPPPPPPPAGGVGGCIPTATVSCSTPPQ